MHKRRLLRQIAFASFHGSIYFPFLLFNGRIKTEFYCGDRRYLKPSKETTKNRFEWEKGISLPFNRVRWTLYLWKMYSGHETSSNYFYKITRSRGTALQLCHEFCTFSLQNYWNLYPSPFTSLLLPGVGYPLDFWCQAQQKHQSIHVKRAQPEGKLFSPLNNRTPFDSLYIYVYIT